MTEIGSLFSKWIGQSTTGQGATMLGATLMGFTGGQLSGQSALIGLLSGLALVVWPQKSATVNALTAAVPVVQKAVADTESLVSAYKLGLAHGSSTLTAGLAAVQQAAPVLADLGQVTAAIQAALAAPAAAPSTTTVNVDTAKPVA